MRCHAASCLLCRPRVFRVENRRAQAASRTRVPLSCCIAETEDGTWSGAGMWDVLIFSCYVTDAEAKYGAWMRIGKTFTIPSGSSLLNPGGT